MVGLGKSITHTKEALNYALGKKGAVTVYSSSLTSMDDSKIILKEMKQVQNYNNRCKNNCLRIEISPHKDDSKGWSNEKWMSLTTAVVDKLGLKDNQLISVLHTDTETPHLHIIANRINLDGKAFNDSNLGFRLGKITEGISKRNGFVIAKDREVEKKVTLKALKGIMKEVMGNAPTSLEQFILMINQKGVSLDKHKNRKGDVTGISLVYEGDVFKGSKVGKHYSINNLSKTIAVNAKTQQKKDDEMNRGGGISM